MTTATNSYRLALAFRTHAMGLVPPATRGNELRTRLERATWSAIESTGEPTLDDVDRAGVAGNVRRALMILDVLVDEARVSRDAAEQARRIAGELLANLSSATPAPSRRTSAVPAPRSRSVPVTRNVAPSGGLPRVPARPPRFGWMRRELFLTLLGPSPT